MTTKANCKSIIINYSIFDLEVLTGPVFNKGRKGQLAEKGRLKKMSCHESNK